MSIRAVDYQMLVPNTIQQSKVNQNNNERVRIEHQQVSNEDKKAIERQLNKVNKFERKDIQDQKEHNKKKQYYSKNNKSKHDNSEDNNEHSAEKMKGIGLRIDIKI